ncbi:36.4 kDa proline-rich protein-like [Salvia hispanica]|uniref:36.4 kDa proline-rich protein-like n=1 Tax=Salvia hispanica TaxID=49212 RepID=UPI0020090E56|nr:36.4 kDa proline-rich protein-like [Salvia hispanica]
MASLKILSLLLISILSTSSASLLKPDCGSCSEPSPTTDPNLPLPPVGIPKLPLPPVGIPKLPLPPVGIPKLPLPPVGIPKLPLPPVGIPKLPLLPPVLGKPKGKGKGKGGCPTPSPSKGATCPIDTLKLGACVDLLGGLVHVVLGDPAVNECCPIISGLAEVEAAACLCTTLKVKAVNLEIFVPLAVELLVTCGKTPPRGYTCSL